MKLQISFFFFCFFRWNQENAITLENEGGDDIDIPETLNEIDIPETSVEIDVGLFSCSEYDKKFKWKHCLQRHMSVHRDEKSFSCERCSSSFNVG